jgi:hypothetical protein
MRYGQSAQAQTLAKIESRFPQFGIMGVFVDGVSGAPANSFASDDSLACLIGSTLRWT